MVIEVDQGPRGIVRMVGFPVKLSDTPARVPRHPSPGAWRAYRRGAGGSRPLSRRDRGAARQESIGGSGRASGSAVSH